VRFFFVLLFISFFTVLAAFVLFYLSDTFFNLLLMLKSATLTHKFYETLIFYGLIFFFISALVFFVSNAGQLIITNIAFGYNLVFSLFFIQKSYLIYLNEAAIVFNELFNHSTLLLLIIMFVLLISLICAVYICISFY